MSPSERRQKLIEVLCCRRHDTYYNLAFEFNVSTRTICRDIAALMCSYPLETVRVLSIRIEKKVTYFSEVTVSD